jgi:hypothetical protein
LQFILLPGHRAGHFFVLMVAAAAFIEVFGNPAVRVFFLRSGGALAGLVEALA